MSIPCDESNHFRPLATALFIVSIWIYRAKASLVRFVRIIVLIVACFLHFVHNAIDPLLMPLATRLVINQNFTNIYF